MASSLKTPAVLQVLEESFGANASYVESLLDRFLLDPGQIDESWRAYFEGLVGRNGVSGSSTNGNSNGVSGAQANGAVMQQPAQAAASKPTEQKPAANPSPQVPPNPA